MIATTYSLVARVLHASSNVICYSGAINHRAFFIYEVLFWFQDIWNVPIMRLMLLILCFIAWQLRSLFECKTICVGFYVSQLWCRFCRMEGNLKHTIWCWISTLSCYIVIFALGSKKQAFRPCTFFSRFSRWDHGSTKGFITSFCRSNISSPPSLSSTCPMSMDSTRFQ